VQQAGDGPSEAWQVQGIDQDSGTAVLDLVLNAVWVTTGALAGSGTSSIICAREETRPLLPS
jgi:hypothetical protein